MEALLLLIALVLIHIEDSMTDDDKSVRLHYFYIFVIVISSLLSAILGLVKA